MRNSRRSSSPRFTGPRISQVLVSRAAAEGRELCDQIRCGEQRAASHAGVADLRGGDGRQRDIARRSAEQVLVDHLVERRRVGLVNVVAVLHLRRGQSVPGRLIGDGDLDDV